MIIAGEIAGRVSPISTNNVRSSPVSAARTSSERGTTTNPTRRRGPPTARLGDAADTAPPTGGRDGCGELDGGLQQRGTEVERPVEAKRAEVVSSSYQIIATPALSCITIPMPARPISWLNSPILVQEASMFLIIFEETGGGDLLKLKK